MFGNGKAGCHDFRASLPALACLLPSLEPVSTAFFEQPAVCTALESEYLGTAFRLDTRNDVGLLFSLSLVLDTWFFRKKTKIRVLTLLSQTSKVPKAGFLASLH